MKKIFSDKLKRRVKERLGVPALGWSLTNLKRIGFNPSFALDIGAYEGEWASSFAEVFPQAKVLMIEAQLQKKEKLEYVSRVNTNLSYRITLLSAEDGKMLNFNENETASHVTDSAGTNTKKVISEALDEVIKRHALKKPDFLKLDVQGFELEVLRGGKECLSNAEFCQLEVTMIDLGNEPLVLEVMNYMDSFNFQLYDITQLMRRPFDKALYQSDFLFIKKTSPLIAVKRWN